MRKMKIAIAALIALSGFSYLIVSGFKESGLYYMKIEELLNSSPSFDRSMSSSQFRNKYIPSGDEDKNTDLAIETNQTQSKKIKVEGDVVSGSIRKSSEQLEFEITDGENKLRVIYSGVDIPSAFKEKVPVVVEGKYKPEQRLFEAIKIITKCPSKYEGKEEEDDR